jgi:hypothetical protein
MHLCVSPDGSAEVGIGILIAPERPCLDDGCVPRLRRGRNWDSICRSRTLRVRSTPRALPWPGTDALDADATFAQEH